MNASAHSTLQMPFVGWNESTNFGDQITVDLLHRVLGYRPVRSPRSQEHLLATGSIFFLANERSHIWGSGLLRQDEAVPNIDPRKVYAVRGHETADRLTREGFRLPDLAFGDPGLLVRSLENVRPSASVVPRPIVIVPHYSTYKQWMWGNYGSSAEISIVDLCTTSTTVLEQIKQADVVVSESLHGLVFASAFGRPALWIGNSDNDNFKYHDWFSTVENPPGAPVSAHTRLEDMISQAEVHINNVDLSQLKQSLPSHIARADVDTPRISFEAARDQDPFCFFFQDQHFGLGSGAYEPKTCFEIAASVANLIFSSWDERPYSIGIVHRCGVMPTRKQLERILFEMNHHIQHDFAVVATRRQVTAAGLSMHDLSDDVAWASGSLPAVSAVVIRPSGTRRGDNYVIFCV